MNSYTIDYKRMMISIFLEFMKVDTNNAQKQSELNKMGISLSNYDNLHNKAK